MASFLPFAGKNSIVEAVFGLQFAQILNPAIGAAFDKLQSEFIADFPKFEKVQMLQFNIGMVQQNETLMAGGFNASRIRPDGNPSRAFRGINNVLSVHIFEYDHWEETKVAALRLFERCFAVLKIPSNQTPITAVVLRFVDRFTYDGSPADASAAKLFRSDTRFVPRKIFDTGAPWSANLGWNEPLLAGPNAQHQLTVQAAMDANSYIMIHHNIQCNVVPLLSTYETGDGKLTLNKIFDAQHETNATLLKDTLNDQMLEDIGLVEKSS